MKTRFLSPLGKASRRTSGAVATYAEVLRDTYGSDIIFPLVDIASGINIPEFTDSNYDGTLTGWDLQNASGPVPGTLAPFSDGANDKGDVYSASIETLLTTTVIASQRLSVVMWQKVANVGVWADGANRRSIIFLGNSAKNYPSFTKQSTNNEFGVNITSGGTANTRVISMSDVGWFMVGITMDTVLSEIKFYLNGVQDSPTDTTVKTWTNASLFNTRTTLGSDGANLIWHGWMAYFAMKTDTIWSPADMLGIYNAAATSGPD